VILLFQPAYSPEVNPIERLWQYLKEQWKWQTFDNLENLREAVEKSLGKLSKEIVASLTGWEFIVDALSVASI
jgi:transposase